MSPAPAAELVADVAGGLDLGRVFAAYGGVFIVGWLVWGVAFEGFRPDRWDLIGGAVAWSAWRSSCTGREADGARSGRPRRSTVDVPPIPSDRP